MRRCSFRGSSAANLGYVQTTIAQRDGGLQLHANLFVGVKIGFKQVALELRFCVNEGCVCSGMAAAQRLGASAQRREFGFEFFHRGFPFEQKCHAVSIGISK
jgi:hypothetical protein